MVHSAHAVGSAALATKRVERRLAAILAADVAGYSRLIGMDEDGTLQAFKTIRIEQFEPTIAAHRGRLVKTTGDGFLVEFSSVVNALRCAVEVQASMTQRNADISPDRRIEFRMGINVGDIVVEDGDIFGDGVNVAVRLEGLAEPGGICVSSRVQEDAAGKLDLSFVDIGEQELKNIARPVRVYRVTIDQAAEIRLQPAPLPLPDKPSVAVLSFTNMSGDPEQECRSPIETSPASPIEMSRSSVCLRLVGVAWDDGDYDEPQRADAPAGADRYCRRTAIGFGRHGAARSWTKTGLPAARCVPRLRPGRSDLSEARRAEQSGSGFGVPRDRAGHRA